VDTLTLEHDAHAEVLQWLRVMELMGPRGEYQTPAGSLRQEDSVVVARGTQGGNLPQVTGREALLNELKTRCVAAAFDVQWVLQDQAMMELSQTSRERGKQDPTSFLKRMLTSLLTDGYLFEGPDGKIYFTGRRMGQLVLEELRHLPEKACSHDRLVQHAWKHEGFRGTTICRDRAVEAIQDLVKAGDIYVSSEASEGPACEYRLV
jgi:hypothetical protein